MASSKKPYIQIPTKEKYQKIYSIIINYKWPTNYYNFIKDNEKFSEFILYGKEEAAEEKAIRAAIKMDPEISGCDIAFIPDIVYETGFMIPYFEGKNKKANKEIISIIFNTTQRKIKTIDGIIDRSLLSLYSNMHKNNKNSKTIKEIKNDLYKPTIEWFFNRNIQPYVLESAVGINKKIYDALRTAGYKKNKPDEISKYFYEQIIKIRDTKVQVEWIKNTKESLVSKDLGTNLILKLVFLETEAHKENKALIFRATSGDLTTRFLSVEDYKRIQEMSDVDKQKNIQSILTKKDIKVDDSINMIPSSLSYGNSMTAGTASRTGGDVIVYAELHGSAYALTIDKSRFFDINNARIRNLFWIPPLGTITSYYGVDDLFHPRTTVGMMQEWENILFDTKDYIFKGKKDTNYSSSEKINIDQLFTYPIIMSVIGIDTKANWLNKMEDIAYYINDNADTLISDKNGKNLKMSDISMQLITELLSFNKHQKSFRSVKESILSYGIQKQKKEDDTIRKRIMNPGYKPPKS